MSILNIEMTASEYETIKELIIQYGQDIVEKVYENIYFPQVIIKMFRKGYEGKFDSQKDFAKYILEKELRLPEKVSQYMDYQYEATRLFEYKYESYRLKNKTYVFKRI